MKKKNTGVNSGATFRHEIRSGDIYKDSRGERITVTEVSYNRVTYFRNGYKHPCVCNTDRLLREFSFVSNGGLVEWHRANNTSEKIEKLRQLLRRGSSEKRT